MKSVYVESSALGRAFIHRDTEAHRATRAALAGRVAVTSRLTLLELERAILRAQHDGAAADLIADVRRRLRAVTKKLHILEITPAVWTRAAQGFAVEPVRTLDALHLASLLEWEREVGGDLVVLTRDRRVAENAEAYALRVM